MPTYYPAPKTSAIGTLFENVLGSVPKVTIADSADPERDALGMFAEFVTDADELAVMVYADPEVVNLAGGALMQIPAAAIIEASGKGALHEGCIEGFQEVVNAFASCLNCDFTPHLRPGNVIVLPGQLSDEVEQLWREPGARRGYTIKTEDRKSGALILSFI